jgi:hypothetical protein
MTAQIERVAPIVADEDGAKRRQIIEGARRVFLAQGFDAASMGAIARAAGVSKGTLYVYFENKERLLDAIGPSSDQLLLERLLLCRVSDAGQRQPCDIHQWPASESRQGTNPRRYGRRALGTPLWGFG